MGNGTTCNLQLVKQNAKKKGEVSTGLFLLSFFLVFSSHVHAPHAPSLRRECTPSDTPTTATTTAECKRLFTGIKSGRMEVKDLGGPTGEKRERERKEGTQRKRLVAPDDGGRRQEREGARGGGATRRGSGRIYLSQQRHRSPRRGQPMQMLDI